MVPRTLLGGLWLQFAGAFTGGKPSTRCQQWGTWFEVSAAGATKRRLYCSAVCKTMAYRARKARVAQRYVARVPVEVIAQV